MADGIGNSTIFWNQTLPPSCIARTCVAFHHRFTKELAKGIVCKLADLILRIVMLAGAVLVYPTLFVLSRCKRNISSQEGSSNNIDTSFKKATGDNTAGSTARKHNLSHILIEVDSRLKVTPPSYPCVLFTAFKSGNQVIEPSMLVLRSKDDYRTAMTHLKAELKDVTENWQLDHLIVSLEENDKFRWNLVTRNGDHAASQTHSGTTFDWKAHTTLIPATFAITDSIKTKLDEFRAEKRAEVWVPLLVSFSHDFTFEREGTKIEEAGVIAFSYGEGQDQLIDFCTNTSMNEAITEGRLKTVDFHQDKILKVIALIPVKNNRWDLVLYTPATFDEFGFNNRVNDLSLENLEETLKEHQMQHLSSSCFEAISREFPDKKEVLPQWQMEANDRVGDLHYPLIRDYESKAEKGTVGIWIKIISKDTTVASHFFPHTKRPYTDTIISMHGEYQTLIRELKKGWGNDVPDFNIMVKQIVVTRNKSGWELTGVTQTLNPSQNAAESRFHLEENFAKGKMQPQTVNSEADCRPVLSQFGADSAQLDALIKEINKL